MRDTAFASPVSTLLPFRTIKSPLTRAVSVFQKSSSFITRPFLPVISCPINQPSSFRKAQITMVMTKSLMHQLGTVAPDFSLVEPLTGEHVSLDDVMMEHGLLVVFMCNHCPFVVMLQDQLRALGTDLKAMGIGMVGISSNDSASYPADGPAEMKKYAETKFSSFKYLYDETQETAKAFGAACTPDLFMYNKDKALVYRGQVDYARPGNGKLVNGQSVRAAAKLLREGKPIPAESMVPSIGCSIKWKRGNEPGYFG